jgi:hypothetical protein
LLLQVAVEEPVVGLVEPVVQLRQQQVTQVATAKALVVAVEPQLLEAQAEHLMEHLLLQELQEHSE